MSDPQLQIPFAGGPDEATDPRHLPPGSVISAANQVYDAEGQYQVRYGYTLLSGGGPSSLRRLASFANELIAIDGTQAWAWAPNGAGWTARDRIARCGVTHRPAFNSTSTYQSWGEAVANGYRCVAWIDKVDNLVRAAVYDPSTTSIVSLTTLGSHAAVNLFVGVVGSYFVVTAADSGAANIRAWALATTLPASWSAGSVVSDANYATTLGIYCACFQSNGLVVAYEQSGGKVRANRCSVPSFSISVTAVTTLTAGTSGIQCMAARGTSGENTWVGFIATQSTYSSNCVVLWLDPSAMTLNAAVPHLIPPVGNVYQLAIERVSSTQNLVAHCQGSVITYGTYTSAGIVGSETTVNNASLASAPCFSATLGTTVCYFGDPVSYKTTSYYLMDLSNAAVIAVLAPSIAPSLQVLQTGNQVNVPAIDPTALETVLPIDRTTNGRLGLEFFTLSSYAGWLWGKAPLGKELYIGGQYYDGARIAENGFAQQPQFSVAVNAAGTVSRQYAVTYVRIDAQGNLEESAPAPVQTIASQAASPNNTLTVNTTALTSKQRVGDTGASAKVYLVVYRSQDLSTGDINLYRVTVEPFTSANLNDPTVTSITIADTASDATISANAVIYTMTGELAHDCPETFIATVAHKQRVWGIGADQSHVWYSQTYVDGYVPSWSRAFLLSVDDAGEPLTALGSLYDKLVIFTARKIFVVFGDGPSIAGTGSDLTAPQQVPSPSGCIDPRSIVNTPAGLMFQSQRGIELLGADLSVTFIGLPVSKTTATYPICTSAVLCETTSTVRFTFTTSEAAANNAGNGAVVLYDLRRGRWAVHALTCGGTRGNATYAPMAAATWSPVLGYVAGHVDNAAACLIYRENTPADATPWLDFGTYFVPLVVTTAWIKAGDLQGWQRVRRVRALCNYYDAHGLQASFNYDYQSQNEIHFYSSNTIAGFTVGSWEQVRFAPAQAKCEAIQVTLQTVAPTAPQVLGSGRGAGFVGIGFEIHGKKGGYRGTPVAASA
jgi:hypothetical protein